MQERGPENLDGQRDDPPGFGRYRESSVFPAYPQLYEGPQHRAAGFAFEQNVRPNAYQRGFGAATQ